MNARVGGIDYLDLLAREAALVEFERPLIAARAAGASTAELDELEQAKLLALRVRALLERRRRREEELSALYDTAGDLAGLRDVDAVLRAIVHRVRTLLNVDVSYMTLNDAERGDTYMRITDGSVAASFQKLRLPPGAGLGGLVAQTGTPYATANYPRDVRFAHTTDIDMGVGDEGLIAILGVPMRLGSTVIGVLFAANRAERPFAREEVALLLSLAAHASVALDTARLLSETQTALGELSAANSTIRAHSQSVERAAAAHDRMTSVVLRGGGVDDVAADLVDVLQGALLVIDAQGRTLATARTPGRDVLMPEPDETTVGEAVAASRGEGRSVRRNDLIIAAIVAGADNLGALVFRPAEPLEPADQRILERAAQVTALLLLFRRTVAEAEAQVRGDLLDDLISRPVRDPDAVRDRAARLGLDLDAPYVIVAAGDDPGEGLRQRAVSWARTFVANRRGLAMARDGRVTLLLPGEDPAGTAKQVAKELSRALGRPVTAGGAGPARGAVAVAPAFREADQCLSALITLGRAGSGAGTKDLGYVGLLLGERRDVPGFVHAVLGPVIDYDARRGTALITTLEVYFDQGGGLAKAAEALHVHVNTVTQRLDRVAQLLGDDWQHPRRVLDLQLALRLHRLRAPLEPDHT
ncbi:cyclic diguanylate phosphodiesterase [Actinoplanes ianthinogenes]|uniref:Cyclic diguanylate phosphodiesterase n=1 Tax=Actinoplanes ianthinogenes TaxID=122358 RepID=A0ABM7LL64_9ACTN|nr:helix-turn-helix domain-containing protein [Actinoplanes ianthinogenes]BCJ39954.1 cyclic diguanylate phosphodiesterase [Actinoplanes ianthinogenes]GGR09259.1 cyclic diguanylate phosphodiesterase [Actinoplanes ianthinogenes]